MPPGVYTSTNKKAIAAFESSVKYYQSGNDVKAKEEAMIALEKDANFAEPHLLISEIFQTQKKTQEAIDEYVKAITINPTFNLSNYYNIAMLEISIGKYEDAKKDFERFLKKSNINSFFF